VLLSHFGVILGSFSDHFRVILGSFWTHLGSFWNHFGVILGPFWDHFGSLYKKKDPKTTQNDPYQNNKKTGQKVATQPQQIPARSQHFPGHRAGIPLGITVRFITPAPGENVGAKRRAIGFGGPPPVPPRPPLLFILPPTRIFLIFWHVVGGKYLRSMEKTRGQKKSMGKSYARFSVFGPIRRF
jgi:hypothetical protein